LMIMRPGARHMAMSHPGSALCAAAARVATRRCGSVAGPAILNRSGAACESTLGHARVFGCEWLCV
jgi:hypothetical protein